MKIRVHEDVVSLGEEGKEIAEMCLKVWDLRGGCLNDSGGVEVDKKTDFQKPSMLYFLAQGSAVQFGQCHEVPGLATSP